MDEPAKYLIHAQITARGVIERNDVVGAVFGQTEGLLGDDLDLRSLQASQRVGRIEVDVTSDDGVSSGSIRIGSDMDRVETAVLAAALETIDRIGPCRATVEVEQIEDIRAAKRRRIYDRAQELVAGGFEDVGVGGQGIVEAVRTATTPVDIESYAGYPAGPGVEDEDELIIVEGRADVSRLLQFGITNVIGVEGTNVPEEVAALTEDRSVTAFFDGDRGGDLLLVELAQIGDVDFVTFAPPGQSVEDLTHADILDALAEKVPYQPSDPADASPEPAEQQSTERSLWSHVDEVINAADGAMWILDGDDTIMRRDDSDRMADILNEANDVTTVILDAPVGQREADLAARHGIALIIGREIDEFTKRPRDVRILAADTILESAQLPEQ